MKEFPTAEKRRCLLLAVLLCLMLSVVSGDPLGQTPGYSRFSSAYEDGYREPEKATTPEVDSKSFVIRSAEGVSEPQTSSELTTSGEKPEEEPVKRYPVFNVEFQRVETPFIIGLWIFCASIAKIGFHMTPKLNKIFPESCLLIVVGVVIGFLLYLSSNVNVSPLTPDTFFLYMLPPIILDAGYFMPNRLFFDHLGTILLMAVIGTIFNTLTIGSSLYAVGLSGLFGKKTPLLEMFLFSALISAVDPVAVLAVFEEIHVNEILYIVVFGESLLNDAVTVVLYHMFEAYNEMGPARILYTDVLSGFASFFVVALGGTLIGIVWGFLTGLVTRYTDEVRVIEPIFIFVMAYLAYLNAEIFHMSGILAITFCGITMKNYVEANISHKSHTTVKYAMKMLSSSSETIIFMFLGVATVNDQHEWNTWFVIMTILFCSVFRVIVMIATLPPHYVFFTGMGFAHLPPGLHRCPKDRHQHVYVHPGGESSSHDHSANKAGVILLTAIANHFRLNKLTKVDKFVMSYGGLRGAVAFALVLLIDGKHVSCQPMFVTTTIAVIYFTVFLQGITIKPLVKFLNVKRAEKRKCTMNERIHERFMDHLMAGIEDIVGSHGNYHIRDKFKRFDNKFIRPYLLRNYQGAEPKILETYSKLAMKDAMEYMRRNASTIGNISGTESMSAIFKNYTAPGFNTSTSLSQLDTSTWNIDLQELEYNPSRKDLTDAKIHHLLSEELCKPRRHRRLSYSRHAVNDRDLATQEVNYKMHMNIRRVIGERKHHKRSKKLNKDGRQNHVSFPEFQQNGSAKQLTNDFIEEVLQDEDIEADDRKKEDWDGITFTAKSSPSGSSGLISQIANLPGFDPTRARLVKQYSKPLIDYDDAPTVAEVSLPWRRTDVTDNLPKDASGDLSGKKYSIDSSQDEHGVLTPTATEAVLPWKRDDSDSALSGGPVKQSEFPAWCSNKEYIAYSSPSATFLGGIEQPKTASVIGLFRRESSGSVKGLRSRANSESSLPVIANKDNNAGVLLIEEGVGVNHPTDLLNGSGSSTASNSSRKPLIGRRGSMLELSSSVDPIPEEELLAGTLSYRTPHTSLPSLMEGFSGHHRRPLSHLQTPYASMRRHYIHGLHNNTSSESSQSSIGDGHI